LTGAALAYPSRPGAARCRTRTHRDKGNDADYTINLPTLHDKPSYPGTVRSPCRYGRRPAAGLCVRLRTSPGSARRRATPTATWLPTI